MTKTRKHDSIYDIRLLVDDWLFEEARCRQVSLPCSGYFSNDPDLMPTFDHEKRKEHTTNATDHHETITH